MTQEIARLSDWFEDNIPDHIYDRLLGINKQIQMPVFKRTSAKRNSPGLLEDFRKIHAPNSPFTAESNQRFQFEFFIHDLCHAVAQGHPLSDLNNFDVLSCRKSVTTELPGLVSLHVSFALELDTVVLAFYVIGTLLKFDEEAMEDPVNSKYYSGIIDRLTKSVVRPSDRACPWDVLIERFELRRHPTGSTRSAFFSDPDWLAWTYIEKAEEIVKWFNDFDISEK